MLIKIGIISVKLILAAKQYKKDSLVYSTIPIIFLNRHVGPAPSIIAIDHTCSPLSAAVIATRRVIKVDQGNTYYDQGISRKHVLCRAGVLSFHR